MDQDEELSLEEFRKWYSHDSSVAVTTVLDEGSSKMTLEETRRVSKLNKFTFSEIKEVFEAGSNSNGTISRDAFLDCFAEIAGCCDDAKERQRKRLINWRKEQKQKMDVLREGVNKKLKNSKNFPYVWGVTEKGPTLQRQLFKNHLSV